MRTDSAGSQQMCTLIWQSLSSAANPLLLSPLLPRPDEVIWPCKASLDGEIMNELTKHVSPVDVRRTAGLTRCWRPHRVRVHTCGRQFAEIWWIVCVFSGNPPADSLHRAQRNQHLLMSHRRLDVIKVCWFENANYLSIGCMIKNIRINFSDVVIKKRKGKHAEES